MRRPAWPCFDCGGLITSGQERQTFNSVPFCSILFHSLSSTRGRNARFAGFTNEVQHQTKVLPWDTHRSPLRNGVRLPAYVPRAPRSGRSLRLLLRSRLEMRPPRPRLALGSLVCADQRGLVSIVVASLRVARSGKLLILFRFVPFCSIPYRLRGAGMRGSRLRGNDGRIRGNDVYEQCSSQRGYGVRGSCRWFGGWGVRSGWRDVRAGRGPGCEIPACAGTTAGSRGMTRGLAVG